MLHLVPEKAYKLPYFCLQVQIVWVLRQSLNLLHGCIAKVLSTPLARAQEVRRLSTEVAIHVLDENRDVEEVCVAFCYSEAEDPFLLGSLFMIVACSIQEPIQAIELLVQELQWNPAKIRDVFFRVPDVAFECSDLLKLDLKHEHRLLL